MLETANFRTGVTRRRILQVIGAGASSALGSAWSAPSIPGPVRIIQGWGAASVPDVVARLVGIRMATRLQQAVVVDQKLGGGERVAASYAMGLPPTGQHLFMMTGAQAVIAATDKTPSYDVTKAFAMIGRVVQYPFLYVVKADSPFKSMGDVLAAAKAQPGKVACGIPGTGNTFHLTIELMSANAGVKFNIIPYSNTNIQIDVLAGRLDMGMLGWTTAKPLHDAGSVRIIGVTSPKRMAVLPEVPAVNEFVPNSDVTSWLALAAPGGVPIQTRDFLASALQGVLSEPELQRRLEKEGLDVAPLPPAEMTALLKADIAKFQKIAKAANITVS